MSKPTENQPRSQGLFPGFPDPPPNQGRGPGNEVDRKFDNNKVYSSNGHFYARFLHVINRPRSIYQYSNMAPRLSGQTSIFDVVFFVSKSLLGIERQKKLEKFAILTRKPRSHARILIYRTWPIALGHFPNIIQLKLNSNSSKVLNKRLTKN